jgi:hypothetical protein
LPERRKGRGRPGRTALLVGAGFAVVVLAGIVVLAFTSTGGPHRRAPTPTRTAAGAPTTPPTSATATTTTTTTSPSRQGGLGPPGQPPPNGRLFGASVNIIFNSFTYTQPQINAQLQALHETGATIARSDAFWEAAEPYPPVDGLHHYDWSFADSVAGSLAAHRLQWLPIIDYSAPWAQSVPGQDHSPPSSVSSYASYAAALAARYGRGGSFWRAHPNIPSEPVDTYEIWNEPDQAHFWVPSPDASRYIDLYVKARDVITAVDPTARVIVGGLTNPQSSLPAMLAARPDVRSHIDGVAVHIYLRTPAAILAAVRADRALLASLGMSSVPLYVTEFGWTRRPKGARFWLPEWLRPRYITATLAGLGHLGCGIAGAFLYTWVTLERNPADDQDWFGINPPRGGSSADTRAFAAGLRAAASATTRTCAGGQHGCDCVT